MKYIMLLFSLVLSIAAAAAYAQPAPSPKPDESDQYQILDQAESKPAAISELNADEVVQLNRERQEIQALLARRLGITGLHRDTSDLDTIQKLIDSNLLKKNQVMQWQEVGVVFGDILAKEFNLHWVKYDDGGAVSTALQWRDTQNFVFPVTMFSKRVEVGEKLDAHALYNEIKKKIEDFIAYENRLPSQK